jgi:hypothetical protein
MKGKAMNDPIDSAIENTESQTGQNPRGPRARHYFCAAIRGKNIVAEAIEADSPEEAQELFKEKHSLNATMCDVGKGNGYYVAMGTGMSDAQRISVTVTPAQLARRTTAAYRGHFKGWEVWASGLCGCKINDIEYDDNDLVSIEFGERVQKDSGVPKPKLKKREVVRLADLENVQTL